EADQSGAVEPGARARPAVSVRGTEEVTRVRHDASAERPAAGMRVGHAMPPPPRQVDSQMVVVVNLVVVMNLGVVSPGPFARPGGTSLQRSHECEHQGQGNGEQQYEEANRPQESG